MEIAPKLEELVHIYEDLERRMADSAAEATPQELQQLAKKHSDLQEVVHAFRDYQMRQKRLEESRQLASCGDAEMEELARSDMQELEAAIARDEDLLRCLLLPRDPNDEKNVILEIRGGAGGDEAALFAGDLFRMYTRFAERLGWKVEILTLNETGIGGVKEAVFRLDGHGAYSKLKFESGAHRVQRVPVTEASGRIHTSTATVAVLPEVDDVEVDVRTEDLKIDTYRASGAGGQYVNMTDSAVRITHVPTGLVVTCQDERSQLKNRVKAMKLLRARLYDLELQKQQSQQAAERRGQVGTGDRSERIRTYNFPQNRLSDHRIGLTLHKLDLVLDGDLDEMVQALTMADQTARLQQSASEE